MRKTNRFFSVMILCLSASSVYARDFYGFYLELFGGVSKSVMGPPDAGPATSGAFFSGQSRDVDLDFEGTYGVRAGYTAPNNFRFDISYYDANSELKWMTDFPGCCTSTFTANIDFQILLASVYYNFTTRTNLSPYIGLGVGQSRNKFQSGKEYFNETPGLGSFLSSNAETEFAYRLAVGADYMVTENLYLSADLSIMNVGNLSSGSSRSLPAGASQIIGAYKFEDIWLSTLAMSLKYHF